MLHVATNINSKAAHSGNRKVSIRHRLVEPRYSKFERNLSKAFQAFESAMQYAKWYNWFLVVVHDGNVGIMGFDNFKSAQFQFNQYKALFGYECKKQSYYIAVFNRIVGSSPLKVSYFENFPKPKLSVRPVFKHHWIAKVSCDSDNPNSIYNVCPKVSTVAYNRDAMFTKHTAPNNNYGYKARLEFRRLCLSHGV